MGSRRKKRVAAGDRAESRSNSLAKAAYTPPRLKRYGPVLQVTGSAMALSLFDAMTGDFTGYPFVLY